MPVPFCKKVIYMFQPDIKTSTPEERKQYIQQKYHCINDCDMCGICTVFHNKDPELVFQDYIDGKREFMDILTEYRR